MTKYCFERPNFTNSIFNTNNNNKLINFTTIILSKPVYLCLFIFFSPYLFNLFTFLFPLFITITLLILTSYNTLLKKLLLNFDNESEKSHLFDVFEVYKIVFETPIFMIIEENPDEIEKNKENPDGFSKDNILLEEKTTRVRFEVNKQSIDDKEKLSQALSYQSSFESMKNEKEWRDTLACKLFEEKHNWVNYGVISEKNEEQMDLLWETYETESNRGETGEVKKGNKGEKIEDLIVIDNHDGYENEENDENGKFCCVQALKLSARKMNLSLGRSKLIKIGKAFKGIGLLQNNSRGKQRRKGYK